MGAQKNTRIYLGIADSEKEQYLGIVFFIHCCSLCAAQLFQHSCLEELKSFHSYSYAAFMDALPSLIALKHIIRVAGCRYLCLSSCVAPSYRARPSSSGLAVASRLLDFQHQLQFLYTRIRFASSHSKPPKFHLSWFSDVSTFSLVGVPFHSTP